eukprot:4873014-Pyramimonas_sp.AAC.1
MFPARPAKVEGSIKRNEHARRKPTKRNTRVLFEDDSSETSKTDIRSHLVAQDSELSKSFTNQDPSRRDRAP